MKIDGIQLIEGADITNLVVQSGTTWPDIAQTGELFFNTTGSGGLFIRNGDAWHAVTPQDEVASTITATGDVTGSGSGSVLTLHLTPVITGGTFNLPGQITVNDAGQVTAITSANATSISNALGYIPYNSANPAGYTSNTGTVTSIDISGGSSGLSFSGGPVTTAGVFTLQGKLGVAYGGTGSSTATGTGSVVLQSGPTLASPNITGNLHLLGNPGEAGNVATIDTNGNPTWAPPSISFADIQNKPTTLAGYGITDGASGGGGQYSMTYGNVDSLRVDVPGGTQTIVDNLPINSVRAAKYIAYAKSGNDFQMSEIDILQDGQSVYMDELTTIITNQQLVQYDTLLTGDGVVQLLCTVIGSTPVRFTAVRTTISI